MNETTFVWTTQDIKAVCAVLDHIEMAKLQREGPHDTRPGGRRRRDVLNAIRHYCTSERGPPRTYAAKTLRLHLDGGAIQLSEL